MKRSIFKRRANGDKVRVFISDEKGRITIGVYIVRKGKRCEERCSLEEGQRIMPSISKFLPLDDVKLDTHLPTYCYENALHHILNNNESYAQSSLNATDEEMCEIVALVRYGLHKSSRWGFYACDKDAEKLFSDFCENLGIRKRYEKLLAEFYEYLSNLAEPEYVLHAPVPYGGTLKLYMKGENGNMLIKTSKWDFTIDRFCKENGIKYTLIAR